MLTENAQALQLHLPVHTPAVRPYCRVDDYVRPHVQYWVLTGISNNLCSHNQVNRNGSEMDQGLRLGHRHINIDVQDLAPTHISQHQPPSSLRHCLLLRGRPDHTY